MFWTSARAAGSVLAAATAALVTAMPASAASMVSLGNQGAVGQSTVVSCGLSYPASGNEVVDFPANTVTLRSGPSNSCIQKGQGVHDQHAQYICYTPGDGGTWTYLRNTSTGDEGWVRDDLLPNYGSGRPCDTSPPPSSVRS